MCENEMPNRDLTGKCDGGSLYAERGNYGRFTRIDMEAARTYFSRLMAPKVHTRDITQGLELMEERARTRISFYEAIQKLKESQPREEK